MKIEVNGGALGSQIEEEAGGEGWLGDVPEVIPGSRGNDVATKQNLFPALSDYGRY